MIQGLFDLTADVFNLFSVLLQDMLACPVVYILVACAIILGFFGLLFQIIRGR